MAEIRGTYVYDDALRPGQSKDGGLSQLLFDGYGKLADHAVFIPDHEGPNDEYAIEPDGGPSAEEIRQAIAIGVGVVVVAGAVQAAPQIKGWWLDTVMPRFRKLSRTRPTRVNEEPARLTAAPADISRSVEVAIGQPDERMSRADAEKRLVAVLAAGGPPWRSDQGAEECRHR